MVSPVGNGPRWLWSNFVINRVCYGPSYPVKLASGDVCQWYF